VPCSDLRFLVVEDHEFQRKMLVHLLRFMGAKAVHTAEDGRTALQVIRDPDRTVDIVISDLSMPGMDGMEFIRHLSEMGDRVSIILASALDRDLLASIGNMANAYKVKLLGVIGKPPTAAKLTPLIELHRQRRGDADKGDAVYPLADIADAWTHNEFEPWFEPQIDLETRQVRGVHAAPRWRHPIKGLLDPDSFMPSLQARGLNDDFVWLMLQKCAAQCQLWRSKELDLVVSLNLPFQSVTDVKLAARVAQIVANEGLEPRFMVLGFAETSINTDAAKALENLARLRVEGFGLAVDDFGSGPMAVEQLSLVAFTELKIHRSFVSDADNDESVRAGLAVGLETAQKLKLRTVADGIRSKDEWKLLHEWGCHLGQGPFISPPLEGAAVPAWVARWSRATIA
jgi:EAL domain-containing protein (putative c-di-GMP-specific phosphodiesterase class I)/AmiR/NasT family two-component response regulator